jgi:hypothetical protein
MSRGKRSEHVLAEALAASLREHLDPVTRADPNAVEVPVGWVIGHLWRSKTPAPKDLRQLLGLQRGATCAQAAQALWGEFYGAFQKGPPQTVAEMESGAFPAMQRNRLLRRMLQLRDEE